MERARDEDACLKVGDVQHMRAMTEAAIGRHRAATTEARRALACVLLTIGAPVKIDPRMIEGTDFGNVEILSWDDPATGARMVSAERKEP